MALRQIVSKVLFPTLERDISRAIEAAATKNITKPMSTNYTFGTQQLGTNSFGAFAQTTNAMAPQNLISKAILPNFERDLVKRLILNKAYVQ
mmetsp:Transcript_17288/g.23815  ORF Transcript_17288/g.23815 Transcript_17288/m.23815 type:complete len:92 (+) Transcript_17288:144-419(+)|eukprot:CAMPEP_0185731014 /NCGR_PEP_ID=MMETSP1171-20130828/11565_1 /TAXON_ID=374046 /ORGANISM="Helicotheca tamensis, Strain CCMP826" /LENGTH=91 /DNA_ID=CAMNT_0028400175 /DNA_START=74 /DNA_END=349 /DNA_ORIENTATION=+